MGLREALVDLVRLPAIFFLFVPPDADLMSRRGQHVGVAVAVEIGHAHLRTSGAEGSLVKFPGSLAGIGRLLPPAVGDQDVDQAVAIDVAGADAVREPIMTRCVRIRNGFQFPQRFRVGCALGIADVASRIVAQEQFALAVAIDVVPARAFVIRHRSNDVRRPGLTFLLGLLEPMRLDAGKTDNDQIRAAVAVDVLGEIAKRIAVTVRIELSGLFQDRDHVPIGRGVVDRAGRDIELAVVIEIADRSPFAAKFIVEHGFLERDFGPACRP